MSHKKNITLVIIAALILGVIFGYWLFQHRKFDIHTISSQFDQAASYSGITILNPFDKSLFPPDFAPPVFTWKDTDLRNDTWVILFNIKGNKDSRPAFESSMTEWTPDSMVWESIRARAGSNIVQAAIVGLKRSSPKITTGATIQFSFTSDSVAAPMFYRDVNLPFVDAVKDPSTIHWRFGSAASMQRPNIVLSKLPVCGNCHSFSADGSIMGMDVDYANDKGSYAISRTASEMTLATSDIISWADYRREDRELTFGLLSQVSPCGRYVISTVKDRSVFVPRPDLAFSQLFFPIKGILCIYDRKTETFRELKGANDPDYVQSNATWSPDGKYILFARSKKYTLKNDRGSILLSEKECEEFISGKEPFKFDIYRVPFNGGNGGEAVPLDGASHNGMSNFFPRYSPDGKWIVFCKAANYMLLQPDSKLYIMPAYGGGPRELECNTSRMNSWHSWSPNSRWLVFSSKVNSPYTQLFITHIDDSGRSSVPLLLSRFTSEDRAANIPEFVNVAPDAIGRINEKFIDDRSYQRAGYQFNRWGDPANAIVSYKKALQLNPDNGKVHNELASIYKDMRNFEQALFHFKELVRLSPQEASGYNNIGTLYLDMRNPSEAMNCFQQALELDPGNAITHTNLGILCGAKNNFDDALKHYKAALKDDPYSKAGLTNAGDILNRMGKTGEAIEYYKKVCKYYPEDPSGFHNVAVVFQGQGKLEEAARYYKKSTEIDSTNFQEFNLLGTIYQKTGRYQEAIDSYLKSLTINPNYFSTHNNLGTLYQTMEQYQQAIRYYTKALAINPKSSVTHYNLAIIFEKERKYGDAIYHYQEVLKLNPGDFETHYNIGNIYTIEGRLADARACYEAALRIRPDFTQAKESLNKLSLR
ncbi:MAG: tetratricopeptide repeat protein [Chitinivibrionales bacterium]|nr:tetratricopeptide repeat protein [Chitinivibrionales bacterium]